MVKIKYIINPRAKLKNLRNLLLTHKIYDLKLTIDPIYDFLLKNEPVINKGIKILHSHQGTTLPTRPKRVAAILAYKRIISQQNN